VKEVLCDIAPTNSCHLLLRWTWLHFKTLNLDERSLYLRPEGQEMKLKFMTPRQAKKDQYTLKEKIKKERIEKEEKKNAEGREIEEKEKDVKKKITEKVVENKVFNRRPPMFSCICLRKRQQCCKPKIGGETQVTNKLSFESSKDQIHYRTICERSIM